MIKTIIYLVNTWFHNLLTCKFFDNLLVRVYRRLSSFVQRISRGTSLFTQKSRVGDVHWWIWWIQSLCLRRRVWDKYFLRKHQKCSWSRYPMCRVSCSPKIRCSDVSWWVCSIKSNVIRKDEKYRISKHK